MCSKEMWRKALDYNSISKETRKELEAIKNNVILDNIIDKIIKKNTFSVRNIESKRDDFKYSIKYHINWMISDIKKGKVDFSQYEEFTLKEEHYAYCLFYTYLSKENDILNHQHKEIVNLLVHYFELLSNYYCND